MRQLVCLLSLFLFSVIQLHAQTTDKNISSSGFSDTEPFIAVNPANPNNLIAAWMHMTLSLKMAIYTKASFDGGATWSAPYSMPHVSPSFTSADVSLAFNSAGTAFISYVDYKMTIDSGFVRTASSTDGGISWSAPVNAVSRQDSPDIPVDRPWMVADQSSGPYSGRLYIVSKSYYAVAPPQKVWLTVSADSGKSWSPIKQLDDSIPTGLTNIMGTPAVGADGAFYVAYISYKPLISPFIRVICAKSTDGGNSFTRYDAMHYAANSVNNDTLYQGSYSLSANPVNAGNLVFQCTDSRNGDMDVLSVYSNDGGLTWSGTPACVNNDGLGNGYGQDMSWGCFSPSGVYGVVWRDRRNGINNDTSDFEIYTALSMDGGANFSGNYKFSSAPSSFVNMQRGNDFLGLCMTNSAIAANWCDTRTGNNEIFFRSESMSVISAISNTGTKMLLNLYPNPTSGKFSVSVKETCGVEIYDRMGAKVISSTTVFPDSEYIFDLSVQPKGLYFVHVRTERGLLTTRKIILL